MHIEDLSKSQLLLLTVLVNFVTSIATAVLTVSLLDEAPPTVTQTVNRIVDHTIETVTQIEPGKPETVIVRDQDLLTSAIAETVSRTAMIHERRPDDATLAVGSYLSGMRAVVTAGSSLPRQVLAVFPDSTSAEASFPRSDRGVTVFSFAEGATLPSVEATTLVPASDVRQGQTVIGITADGSVATGIVTKIDGTNIYTSLPTLPYGSAVVDLEGDVVGVAAQVPGTVLSADIITALLSVTP